MEELRSIVTFVNWGGVVGVLVLAVLAFWRGWIVRASEYDKVVKQVERLQGDNQLLRETLSSFTTGIGHPVRQTLEAIPTPEVVS